LSERDSLCVKFSVKECLLDSLNPGDIFFDGNTLWVTINRHENGYLVKLAGTTIDSAIVMKGDHKVYHSVRCESVSHEKSM
jgi:hypothetical protein